MLEHAQRVLRQRVIPDEAYGTRKIWGNAEQLAKQSVLRCGAARTMYAEHFYWRYAGNAAGNTNRYLCMGTTPRLRCCGPPLLVEHPA